MVEIYIEKKLDLGKVKIWFVCPTCRQVDMKIVKDYEVNPANYHAVKRDGFGNTVYICNAPCAGCQSKRANQS